MQPQTHVKIIKYGTQGYVLRVFDNFDAITSEFIIFKKDFIELHMLYKRPHVLADKFVVVNFGTYNGIYPINDVEALPSE